MALDLAAVDMGHLHRPAGELGRMQHDEAGPVGDDVGVGQATASKASEPSLDPEMRAS